MRRNVYVRALFLQVQDLHHELGATDVSPLGVSHHDGPTGRSDHRPSSAIGIGKHRLLRAGNVVSILNMVHAAARKKSLQVYVLVAVTVGVAPRIDAGGAVDDLDYRGAGPVTPTRDNRRSEAS